MSTLVDSTAHKPWLMIAVAFGGGLLLAAIMLPGLRQARVSPASSADFAPQGAMQQGQRSEAFYAPPMKTKPVASVSESELAQAQPTASRNTTDAGVGRKIIRTSSLELVVYHPAEVAESITAVAERLGGYLVNSQGGGQNVTAATLTIRVPAGQFERARAEIRKLGLRVETERIDAQDVTRQYVDQDANLRNLRAEEAQYLAILKQANTVKDMLVVSEKLSEVRGQIEQQQAEFNALSQQIETVSITIGLRTEAEAQVFGLNWRPGYQLKLALRDGLDSLANYASAMATILFYLPAGMLWTGTILIACLVGWRTVRWVGRRFFGWTVTATPVHG